MKDKTIAAVLAAFGGSLGLHRFYLGQTGLGVAYLLFFWVSWVLGVIDAIVLLTMDQKKFDLKYNQDAFTYRPEVNPRSERERRYAERQRKRENSFQPVPRRKPVQQPRPSGRAQKNTYPDSSAEREAGIKYFRDFEFDRAILAFRKALEKNPTDVAAHFNIACAYSAEEDADKAFYHLDRAVALGFRDTERIKTQDALAFLRVQPAFPAFADNGFRLVADRFPEETQLQLNDRAAPAPTPDAPAPDLLEQLQQLAALREKGLLTEGEFAAQKRRLLG